MGGFESPFEEAVAGALAQRGWQVVPQVGVSGFRVDLGIVHPDRPGEYLAGVECDGATYHRSASARDRDKTREQILTNLGWNILRIWSPDWWYDGQRALQKVDEDLRALLETSRPELPPEIDSPSESRFEETPSQLVASNAAVAPMVEREPEASADPGPLFRRVDLDDFDTDPDQFFDDSSSELLTRMIHETLAAEAPIRDDLLFQRIARAYGWPRTGAKIRERLERLLTGLPATHESTGRFLWAPDQLAETIPFRHPATEDDRRSVDEISIAELLGLIQQHPEALSDPDPATTLARNLGISRVAKSTRARLEEAIEAAEFLRADVEEAREVGD